MSCLRHVLKTSSHVTYHQSYGSRGSRVQFTLPLGAGIFSLSLLFPIFQSVVRPLSGPSGRSNTTRFSTFQENEKHSIAALYALYEPKENNTYHQSCFSRSEEAESVAGARVFGGAGKLCLGDLRNPRYFGSVEIGTEELPRRH